jgi:RHS repeat-associated protein
MTADLNKNIATIRYNVLNLPDTVQMRNGCYVSYMWDGSGNKIVAWHRTYTGSTATIPLGATMVTNPVSYSSVSSVITSYYENFVYEEECLRRFFINDGFVLNTNTSTSPTATSSLVYHYYLKDHLGNNRVVFHSVNDTAVIDQVNNYYPFGMEYGEEAEDPGEKDYQNHLYSGKEFDNKFEMNTYDSGARTMSVDVPVWRTPDPLAENHYEWSQYAYCLNNPIRYCDPEGLDTMSCNLPPVTVTPQNNNTQSASPWYYNIPVFGSSAECSDNFRNGHYGVAFAAFLWCAFDMATLGEGAALKAAVKGITLKGIRYYRYMSKDELEQVLKSGYLRNKIPGKTYFTKDVYKTAEKATMRLSLTKGAPAYRVEFEIINDPKFIINGSKVESTSIPYRPGKGSEFATNEPVQVIVTNFQPLK